jgi:NADPH-dependent 2,4-dienoyl-CoA reductase/sulfur reductase-like enzyme
MTPDGTSYKTDASTVHSNEIPFVDFLLIGGGLASATTAETLRVAGAEGSVAILSAEKTLPYHRPPLSKGFLLNGPDKTNILIHEEAFYRDRDIQIHLGARVCRVDVDSRTIETDGGARFRFGKLLIATGASVDRLSAPGANLAGVHYLHTVSDALSLYRSIGRVQRAVVIGASFIGMELAAAFATRGIATTLMAKGHLLYAKLRSPEVSEFFAEYYKGRDIEVIFGEGVEEFSGTTRVEGVVTSSGEIVPCDVVAVGIGVHPEVGFLRNSGIDVDGGILVNLVSGNQPTRHLRSGRRSEFL